MYVCIYIYIYIYIYICTHHTADKRFPTALCGQTLRGAPQGQDRWSARASMNFEEPPPSKSSDGARLGGDQRDFLGKGTVQEIELRYVSLCFKPHCFWPFAKRPFAKRPFGPLRQTCTDERTHRRAGTPGKIHDMYFGRAILCTTGVWQSARWACGGTCGTCDRTV